MIAASDDGLDSRSSAAARRRRAEQTSGQRRDEHESRGTGAAGEAAGLPSDEADRVAEARTLLSSVPELSEERLAVIKERIRQGYYKRPEVLERIARRMANELSR